MRNNVFILHRHHTCSCHNLGTLDHGCACHHTIRCLPHVDIAHSESLCGYSVDLCCSNACSEPSAAIGPCLLKPRLKQVLHAPIQD